MQAADGYLKSCNHGRCSIGSESIWKELSRCVGLIAHLQDQLVCLRDQLRQAATTLSEAEETWQRAQALVVREFAPGALAPHWESDLVRRTHESSRRDLHGAPQPQERRGLGDGPTGVVDLSSNSTRQAP
jgi:hypothetical protein